MMEIRILKIKSAILKLAIIFIIVAAYHCRKLEMNKLASSLNFLGVLIALIRIKDCLNLIEKEGL